MFSLPDLTAFLAVAETGSVRKAAQRVHKTQSAVSQAIQRIETAAGFALLDRSTYRATLTPQGEVFAKRARPLLRQSESLQAFAALLAKGVEDRIAMAVHGAIAPRLWSSFLAAAACSFPDTVIEVRSGEGDQPLRTLVEGEAQLALLLSPPSDRLARLLDYKQVGRMRFVNVVRSDAIGDASVDEALKPMPQILVSDFGDTSDLSFGVVEGHRHWRVSSHVAKAAVILEGLGWGAVPEPLAKDGIDAGILRPITFAGVGRSTERPIYLYRQADHPMGPVASALWEQTFA